MELLLFHSLISIESTKSKKAIPPPKVENTPALRYRIRYDWLEKL